MSPLADTQGTADYWSVATDYNALNLIQGTSGIGNMFFWKVVNKPKIEE